ncbi:hypothetical protein MTO96_016142 [Rhipicephalus appendiculatus]
MHQSRAGNIVPKRPEVAKVASRPLPPLGRVEASRLTDVQQLKFRASNTHFSSSRRCLAVHGRTMAAPPEQPEKTPRLMVEEASREDLVKQVKRQLALLQKAKAKCDDLNKKCELKDATIEDLHAQRQRWQQDHAELQELRQAYQSLQEAQEKQYQSFQVLEEELATSNQNLVTWRHKYQEVLENLECTQSKMAALNQGTECLRQELQCLEEKNKVANSKIEQLSQSQKQLLAERALMQQQLNALDQEKSQEPAGSDSALEMSPGRMKKKIEELVAQCSNLMQERDMSNSAREALAQEAESANEEAAKEKHGLERQLSDLYQTKEDLEAKEKEFAKILDDNSSLEKLLAEAVNESTELQESVNNLQEKLREAETEKLRLTEELETSKDLAFSESNRLKDVIKSLEDKLAAQIEQHQNVEHELKVSVCQQIESEKLIENLKASFSSCQQQKDLMDIVSTTAESSDTPDNQMALEKLKDAMEQEGKRAVTSVKDLEEALKKTQTEKAGLEEEIANIKKADQQLFEELQTSISKVSLLEKDLNRSFHEKQNIVDELCQVKDLQRFLEDEAAELQQECEKLKAQAGRLEADLDNDRLHIQKLEHELEAAECRDQQSLREVEMLRLQLKEMALQALKYQEAFRDCVPGNMEPHILWKVFHRICQIILEAAEKNLVDIQVEGLLPGIGATLVLNDFGDDTGAAGENREEDREGAVTAEAHEQLRSALENVEEQLKMTIRALNVLQFEKQAIEEELLLEKCRRDSLNKELTASAKQMYVLEEHMTGIEMQFEKKRRELNEKDEFLANALDQITGIRADFEKLEDMKQGHSRLSPEVCMLDSSGKEPGLQDFRKKQHVELLARLSHLELDLKRANHVTHLKAPNQAEASGSEQPETEGVGRGEARTAPVHGDRECDDVDIRQHCSDSPRDMEIETDENENFSDNSSSPRARLLKSSETQTQESTCEEVLMLKAELQAKSKLLDEVHSKLDDQLEQSEKLEAALIARSKDLQDSKVPLPKLQVEPEAERQDSYKEIAYLQRSLQEKEEKLAKFKALVLKFKKDVADKTKQMNFMEKELSDMKQELDMHAQASKQSVQNFQVLQNEYDSLQDKHEATLSMCKDLEGKLASSVNELDAAKHALVDATSEKNTLKQRNDVLTAEVMAWQECKAKLEAKLSSMESQASDAKEQEEKLLGRIKVLEEQVAEANKQLLAEKEEHTKTTAQLEKVQKESQIHKLLDLEIADFEHTVAELNKLVKEKNDQLDGTRKESLAYQSKIASLAEQISFLEDQKKADDERLLAYKETVANLKEELLKSRKCEEELRQAEVRLESEVKAGQLREQDLKKSYATVSQELLVLDSSLRTERVIDQMKRQIEHLAEQLQRSQAETKTARDEYDLVAQQHQSVLLELEKQQKEWRNRLDEVVKQNSIDMGNELEKQLNLQYEKLTTKYQNKLAEQEAEHEQVLQQHLQTIEALKREVAEIQQNPQRPSSPQEELAAVGDISTLERQAAEGSESVSPAQPLLLQTVPWELVPTGSATTLESLLNPRSTEAPPHDKTDDKSVRHLAELLNESESNNLRMTEQIRVLKEEIRRHERNYERQKHAVNLEYLKNIIMKFVTLRGGSEKERLVPVLTTMLKLSPEEKKDLEAVVTKEMQQDAAGASNWGGYLPRWTGFVG